ncbi:unnamed protein product [Schistosoma intercalatum]|nr:unnamed protein product [Schistosoma intercalatum]
MKNRLKLRSTGHSDTKESPSEMLTNNAVEQQEPSSYDNTSSSMSANSSPRSSIYDDFEQSESKTVSDILLFKRNYACGKFTLFTIEKIPMLREELNCTLARDQRMNQFIYVNIGLRIFQCK